MLEKCKYSKNTPNVIFVCQEDIINGGYRVWVPWNRLSRKKNGFKSLKNFEENLGFGENISTEHHIPDFQDIFSLF